MTDKASEAGAPPPYPTAQEGYAAPPPAGGYMPPPPAGEYQPSPNMNRAYPPQQGGAYPPPQAGPYQPQPATVQQPSTVVVQQPMVVATPVILRGRQHGFYSPYPCTGTCPHCQQTITSNVRYGTGALTWIIFGGLCLFGCWLGCACVPFCIDSTKDATHTCPNCNRLIYVYHRLN